MQGDRLQKAEAIFHEVAELPAAEREAVLIERCGSDSELRAFVERLLRHHEDRGLLDTPPPGQETEITETVASPGQTIGPYVLRERIGSGGMGEVWRAEQTTPVRRTVAIKLIKLGMDTKQVVARFEAERQALAMMDHPNIARVLDAGATADGRPYFVMEHVQGISITDYCDRHELKMRDRLVLFTQICEAIQHAHQKGVIHRDLKPSNVLVEVQDDHPVPKVIDFGVAKATAQRLTERTIYTEQGQLIGTPEYMSPEQAEMTGLNVDTRTDIYSLGVLLYEFMVGALPFEPETLRKASYAEIQRILREVDPPRPSTRLSSLGADSGTVAKRRKTDRSSLLGQLKGDLDWITMKALEKDRTRRYASASEFAADILRFLNDEPVVARPPSPAYRMRKYVKRHRVAVGFAGTVALALVAGFVLVTVQNAKIAAARDEAEAVTTTLEDMLASVDPTKSGRDVTVREMLDETAKTLGEKFKNQPLVEGRLRYTVGKTYHALGEYDIAEEHLRRALEIRRERLGEEDPTTLSSMRGLAVICSNLGHNDEAEALYQKTLEMRRRILGEEHPSTLVSMSDLAAIYWSLGRQDESVALRKRNLEIQRRVLGEENRTTIETMSSLAYSYGEQHGYQESEALYQKVVEISRRVLGPEDFTTLDAMAGLARSYRALDRHGEAEALHLELLEVSRRILGDEHPSTLHRMNDLATTCGAQGRYDEAEVLRREILEARRHLLGPEHPATLEDMNNLAVCLGNLGRYDEAEQLYLENLEVGRRVLGDEHPRVVDFFMGNLANLYKSQGRYDRAEALRRESLEIKRRLLGDEHPRTLNAMNNLGLLLMDQGRHDEAELLLREALEACRRVLGDTNRTTLWVMGNLAGTYWQLGNYDEAVALRQEQVERRRRSLGEEHQDTLKSMFLLGYYYLSRDRHVEAEALNRDALEISRRALGEDHTQTNDIRYNLACALAMQDRRSEALTILREAVENGYNGYQGNWSKVGEDPDLASLRGQPEFKAIVEELMRRNEREASANVE